MQVIEPTSRGYHRRKSGLYTPEQRLGPAGGRPPAVGIARNSDPVDPWIDQPDTSLFFVAVDAVGASTVTAQSDRSGGTTYAGVSPFLSRIGGGNRYGSTSASAGRLERSRTVNFTGNKTIILRGQLKSGVLSSLGVLRRDAFNHAAVYLRITSTSIIWRYESNGSGASQASFAVANADDVSDTYGATTESGAIAFYKNGVRLGTTSFGASQGGSVSSGTRIDFIGAKVYGTSGDYSQENALGAFVGGQIVEGGLALTEAAHLNAHLWFVANAPD